VGEERREGQGGLGEMRGEGKMGRTELDAKGKGLYHKLIS